MSGKFARHDRVSGLLRRELAVLIQRELKDPKVGFVGVSDVEVTRDLSLAKVYITHFDPRQVAESLQALNRSSGFLRARLGEMLRMRVIPELRFYHDDSVERGQHIDRLIDAAVHPGTEDSADAVKAADEEPVETSIETSTEPGGEAGADGKTQAEEEQPEDQSAAEDSGADKPGVKGQ